MPTHAEKNRGRRVLFPLKRANMAAFGLYDRAAGRWSVSTASAEKNLFGFRAHAFQRVSLASGRTVFSYCGADPSKAKKRLSAPTYSI
jgi:hypothetical protein